MKPKETIPVFLLGHPEYGRYMEEYGKKKKNLFEVTVASYISPKSYGNYCI